MASKPPTRLSISRAILAVLLFLVAGLSFLWGLFCLFLGGPEGDRGSHESIVWGTGFVAFAVIVAAVAVLLLRVATKPFPLPASPGQP
jgi:hypothetical protein